MKSKLTSGNNSCGNFTFSLNDTFSMLPENISLPKISWNELSENLKKNSKN